MRVDALHRRIVDDVSLLHEAVRDVLPITLHDRYLTRTMSLRAFVARLNAASVKYGVLNEIQVDREVPLGHVVMTGLWLDDSELPENGSTADIRILFHTHPGTKRLRLTQAEWHRRRYFWWQLIMHELIHRHQDTYRNTKSRIFKPWSTQRDIKADQEYFGDYDEIETHGHNAALELHIWWPNKSLRGAIAAASQYTGRLVTPTYNCFIAAFADSPSHPAVKAFKRKLRAWYHVIQKHNYIYQLLELPNIT